MNLVFLAKILILAAFIAGIIIFFGKIKKKNKLVVAGLCVIAVISSFISNAIVSVIPMPKDTVQLTATGEKNPEALSNEVSLKAVVVDGIQYEIQNAVEGKWFWQGDNYMWRNENDPRQPDGVTPSVTLEVPKGNDRKFVFNNNQYRGIVEISCNGESETHDLYSEKSVDVSIGFPGNGLTTAYMIKIGRLALYALFIAVFLAYFAFVALKFEYDVIKVWFGRNWDKLIYASIASIFFIVMFEIGKKGSFWYDEVWSLGWMYSKEYNSISLFYRLYQIWFDIMPYGQEYLLIISELLTSLAIFILGLAGSLFGSKRLGAVMAALSASSTTVIYQCGLEFRNYAYLLLASSLSLYFFIKKQKELDNIRLSTLFIYGLSLAFLMDSHTFGLVTAGLLMIFDFILIILRKAKIKCILEFIIPGAYGVLWLFTDFLTGLSFANNYSWPASPSLRGVFNYIIWLCSNNYILFILLIAGAAIIVTLLIKAFAKHSFDFRNDYIFIAVLGVPLLFFAFNIFYSCVLNPRNSLFVNRYFVSLIVFFTFIIGFAVDKLVGFLINASSLDKRRYESCALTAAIIVSFCTISWFNLKGHDNNEKYNLTAETLLSQNDIYNDSTICLIYGNYNVNIGFEYYLSHKGKRDSINHSDWSADFKEYQTIYVVYHHGNIDVNKYVQNGYKEVYSNDALRIKKFVKSV